jgi:uncharacterized protein YjiS (DUF1127 family)
MINSYKNWRAYRSTVATLNRMPEWRLADLGIARGDIEDIARRASR